VKLKKWRGQEDNLNSGVILIEPVTLNTQTY